MEDTKKQEVGKKASKNDEWVNPFVGTLSEMLFIFLPLLVLAIVSSNRGQGAWGLLSSPEWSFASAVLIGQAVVKTITVAADGGIMERVGLIGSVLIVVGLVPSLIVLALLLNDNQPRTGLVIVQLVLFVFAIVSYGLVGTLANYAYSNLHRRKFLMEEVANLKEEVAHRRKFLMEEVAKAKAKKGRLTSR